MSQRGDRRKAKFTTRTVRKIGKILGGDTDDPNAIKKIPEFLHPPMAGPRGAGGMGASGPNWPRPETADSCDNLARLSSEPGLKWCHPVPQLEQPAPCCLAGCAGTLVTAPSSSRFHGCRSQYQVFIGDGSKSIQKGAFSIYKYQLKTHRLLLSMPFMVWKLGPGACHTTGP